MPVCYVYMVRCEGGALYTGWTNDIEKRLAAHNSGTGAKYTKSRRPAVLVYIEYVPDKSAALKREAAIKRLSRTRKRNLIETAALPDHLSLK